MCAHSNSSFRSDALACWYMHGPWTALINCMMCVYKGYGSCAAVRASQTDGYSPILAPDAV